MKRRAFIEGILAAALATRSLAADRVVRIGYLTGGPRPPDGRPPAVLRDALASLGYVEGRNVEYVGRWAEAHRDRLPALAAELVAQKPDVVVTFGGTPALALKKVSATIPIVFTNAGDAVGIGLAASLARPGGNATGISDQAAELSAKRLELLKEVVPGAQRIAVLWNADDLGMTLRYKEIERAARVLHVAMQPLGVREPEDFEEAFSAMTRERPDALMLVTDALTNLNRKRVIDFAAAHMLPGMYEYAPLVQDGGLMSYGPSADDILRRGAVYVDRIVKGAKPADMPVEQPTRYYLFVNLRTAKALGIMMPPALVMRADQVIE